MNERIKELAKQAHAFVNRHSRENITVNVGDIFEKKFAELIVQECASIYDKIDNGNLHMGTDNYLEALQKHFGHER